MKVMDVTMVRVYVMESSHLLKEIVDYLKNIASIRGISVFRAISGVDENGVHDSSLIDLLLDLPLAIEFFDTRENVTSVMNHLSTLIKQEHIVFWDAKINS